MNPIAGSSADDGVPGVRGDANLFDGVLGVTTSTGHSGVAGVNDEGVGNGVYGRSKNGDGVQGWSSAVGHAGVSGANDDGNGVGVYGRSAKAAGVQGESYGFNGVRGVSFAPGHGAVVGVSEVHNPDPVNHPEQNPGPGVFGQSDGTGVWGASKTWYGVYGKNESNDSGGGVLGESDATGVAGISNKWNGVYGESKSTVGGAGVYGKGKLAGYFEGDVFVTGDIRLKNADCAEDFDVTDSVDIEPGTVMVLGEEGRLQPSQKAYDKCVGGVVSGAGDYKPGIVLDQQTSKHARKPIALLGKVYCKVDAQFGSISVGDLLTTSPTQGHAMKASDHLAAFGAVIGKALRSFPNGQGLIPILIALQ